MIIRKIRHKFNAKSCESDGIKFPSLKERDYYHKLKLAQKSGELLFFFRQVNIDLDGGVKYRADFVEFWADNEVKIVDVKGFKDKTYIMKKKLIEAKYPFTIIEV